MDDTFGSLLRRHRQAAGLSQEALAERAGLSVDAIAALEHGRRAPRPETMRRLAAALGLADAQRAALAAQAVRLPAPPALLIGREQEVAAVLHLLRREGGARLVTLTGPGGVGKTRLALAVATALREAYADGIAWVELAPLPHHALVEAAVAQVLGVRPGALGTRAALLEHLGAREMVLVLDNFEHVLGAAPLVTAFLAACPHLVILVTSRTALRVREEQRFRVAPLAAPADDQALNVAEMAGYAAVRLFVERAQAVRPTFALGEANAAVVARICRRLDGLPLAVELAAARVALLPLGVLLARLEHRLAVLTAGARDVAARQQTLRATLAWSYGLLDERAARLFRVLGAFAGDASLEALEALAGEEEHTEGVLEAAAALVDASLLEEAEGFDAPGPAEARFAILETVREYAMELLDGSGEGAAVRRRHAAYYLALAQEAARHLEGPDQARWLQRLERERDNLRAALAWAQHSDPLTALRFVAALWLSWIVGGQLTEGWDWTTRSLERAAGAPAAERAAALAAAAALAYQRGEVARSATLEAEGLALARVAGDRALVCRALRNLGARAYEAGEEATARALVQEALATAREIAQAGLVADALTTLSQWSLAEGDLAGARRFMEESLALYRRRGDTPAVSYLLALLGEVLTHQGAYGQARACLLESLAIRRAVGSRAQVAACLERLAAVALGERPRASARYAAGLLGQAEVLREASGTPVPPGERAFYEATVRALRDHLDAASVALAWAEGRGGTLGELMNAPR